eukprot:CAMPEP_0117527488 /NCGR_PEP_ID=MMETSP0784-20121206/36824_1 /TAXON_ID=39447 /ORGANISM="" /LENGTH=147 /DNA_ID=CAMNT_0005323743 /DNA_START=119 /DNA_END=562 /DNA_ORIENTATION=+
MWASRVFGAPASSHGIRCKGTPADAPWTELSNGGHSFGLRMQHSLLSAKALADIEASDESMFGQKSQQWMTDAKVGKASTTALEDLPTCDALPMFDGDDDEDDLVSNISTMVHIDGKVVSVSRWFDEDTDDLSDVSACVHVGGESSL